MSVNFQYPEAINSSDLQIWNNAAFDNADSNITSSCSPIQSQLVNRTDSSSFDKENQRPCNGAIETSKIKRDEKKIDLEIEEIEKEINRLSARLQVLRLEKEDKNVKLNERGKRIVPAKFMEQKQNLKKSEENLLVSVKSKVQRRGVSMCPGEIAAGIKFRQLYKPEITPVERRKSCFLKPRGIDEMKVIKERDKSCSLSPKSRKVACKTQVPRQVLTTVGSRKGVKKDDGVLEAIQPKNLFGGKSVPAKKPVKPGRVIASRYNQSTILSAMRKRSLPENDRGESARCDTKRSFSVGGAMLEIGGIQGVKKRWDDVPSETNRSQLSNNFVVPDVLPKIRTARYTADTPRDSGPAKRVAELIGKKSFFYDGEDVDSSVCQELSFADEE